MQRPGVGRACGKVIVVGEHFVLDGAEALAMPLPNFWTEVTWTPSRQPLSIDSDHSLSAAAETDALRMLRAAAIHAGISPLGEVVVRSTVPLHRGFGSSAALAVAALRAARQLRDKPEKPGLQADISDAVDDTHDRDDADLIGAARAVENVVHGSSSGLDPATAMGDGAVVFRDGKVLARVRPHPSLRDARWVLCDVGQAPSTGEAIGRANAARQRMGAEKTAALVARIGAATQDVIRGLREGELTFIARGMRDAASCLEAIDVVDARMRLAMTRSLDAGALAAKQSGAGLGGATLALAPNAEIAEIIARHHREANLPTWTLEIAP